jgi:hypothetical protein
VCAGCSSQPALLSTTGWSGASVWPHSPGSSRVGARHAFICVGGTLAPGPPSLSLSHTPGTTAPAASLSVARALSSVCQLTVEGGSGRVAGGGTDASPSNSRWRGKRSSGQALRASYVCAQQHRGCTSNPTELVVWCTPGGTSCVCVVQPSHWKLIHMHAALVHLRDEIGTRMSIADRT